MSEKTSLPDSQKQYAMVSFSVAVITDMAIDVCKRSSKKKKKDKKIKKHLADRKEQKRKMQRLKKGIEDIHHSHKKIYRTSNSTRRVDQRPLGQRHRSAHSSQLFILVCLYNRRCLRCRMRGLRSRFWALERLPESSRAGACSWNVSCAGAPQGLADIFGNVRPKASPDSVSDSIFVGP